MNPITQQFMMGAAGGKTSYWLTKINTNYSTGTGKQNGQSISVSANGNVTFVIDYGGNVVTLAQMSDLGATVWNTSYQSDGSSNYVIGSGFAQLVACSDGSFVISGPIYDNVNSRRAAFMTFSSSGAYQLQRTIYGSTFGSSASIDGTQQLPNGNLITFPVGGYGTAVIMNSAATSVSVTINTYKPQSTSGSLPFNYRSGASCLPVKIYNGTAYAFGSTTIGSDNINALLVLNSDGSASGTSYTFKQPGYSVDYFIAAQSFAVTSSGVYMAYQCGMLNTTNYFLFSYSSFSSGVQFTKVLYGDSVGGNFPAVEVDAQGNAYLIWSTSATALNIFKYDTTGAIVWKRTLSISSGSLQTNSGAVVTSTSLYLYSGQTIAKLPLDGSLTGTYGPYTWAASTDSDSNSYTLSQTTYGTASSTTTTNPSISTPATISRSVTVTPTQYLMA